MQFISIVVSVIRCAWVQAPIRIGKGNACTQARSNALFANDIFL